MAKSHLLGVSRNPRLLQVTRVEEIDTVSAGKLFIS